LGLPTDLAVKMAQHLACLSVRKYQTESGLAKGWVQLKESHSALVIG
jgi:hypothetical protein